MYSVRYRLGKVRVRTFFLLLISKTLRLFFSSLRDDCPVRESALPNACTFHFPMLPTRCPIPLPPPAFFSLRPSLPAVPNSHLLPTRCAPPLAFYPPSVAPIPPVFLSLSLDCVCVILCECVCDSDSDNDSVTESLMCIQCESKCKLLSFP